MSDNDNMVVWSKNSFLSLSDFNAEPNPSVYADSHSVIHYRPTWVVGSDQFEDKIVFVIQDLKISVEFYRHLSWIRRFQSTSYVQLSLLRHEQGHFDLAELVARKYIDILQKKFDGKIFPTRGRNDEQRKQFAKDDSGNMIMAGVDEAEKMLEQKRQEYDKDTDFGQDLKKQSEYDVKFAILHK